MNTKVSVVKQSFGLIGIDLTIRTVSILRAGKGKHHVNRFALVPWGAAGELELRADT